MKMKTFKKQSTQDENTTPAPSSEETPSNRLTDEMILQTSRKREPVTQPREGISYKKLYSFLSCVQPSELIMLSLPGAALISFLFWCAFFLSEPGTQVVATKSHCLHTKMSPMCEQHMTSWLQHVAATVLRHASSCGRRVNLNRLKPNVFLNLAPLGA